MDPDMILMPDTGYDDDDDVEVGYLDLDTGYQDVGRRRGLRRFGLALAGPLGGAIAARRRRKKKRQPMTLGQARNMAKFEQAAAGVPVTTGQNLLASDQRYLPAGGAVAAAAGPGAAWTITIPIQRPFQPIKLTMSASVSLINVELTSITVGAKNQLAAGGQVIPATLFQGDSANNAISWDPALVGMDIVIQGVNQDATVGGQRIAAGFIGVSTI